MIGYIVKIAEDLGRVFEPGHNPKDTGLNISNVTKILSEELDRLDPRDFAADTRYDFIVARERVRSLSRAKVVGGDGRNRAKLLSQDIARILSSYLGFDNTKSGRNFDFITDKDLKGIIERDYRELSSILLPDGAWKSAVVIAGSILEAVLSDILSSPKFLPAADSCAKAPKDKSGAVLDITNGEGWKLVKLIEVAVDIGVLPQQRAASIDQVLRDYRNFVHPRKEVRAKHPCDEAEALMAKGALDGVCNHLERNILRLCQDT